MSTQENEIWGVHAESNVDLNVATLTVIPAFRSTTLNYFTFPTFGDTSGRMLSKKFVLDNVEYFNFEIGFPRVEQPAFHAAPDIFGMREL